MEEKHIQAIFTLENKLEAISNECKKLKEAESTTSKSDVNFV